MPGSDEQYDLVRVKDASSNSKADTFFVAPKHVGRDGAGTERMVLAETDEPPTPEAGEQYLFLGTDGTLKAKFADGSVTAVGGEAGAPDDAEYVTLASDPDLSAESLHQNLSGTELHDPALHSRSHQDGGADELDVSGLSGVLADAQAPVDHALGGTFHTADTLANLNALVSDATLDGTTDPRDPTLHGSTHQSGGTDELNVTGLSGDLADAQDPKAHASTHTRQGSDTVAVDELGGNDYIYAGAFPGTNADVRLDNAIAAAPDETAVFLEKGDYDDSRIIDKDVDLISPTSSNSPATVSDWTLATNNITLSGIALTSTSESITIDAKACLVKNSLLSGTVTVTDDVNAVRDSRGTGEVILESSSDSNLVDSLGQAMTVTDNGTNNVIGDIV
jgi:hypothetical protein